MVPGSSRNWIAVNAASTIQPQQEKQNMTTLRLIKSIDRSPLRLGLVLIALALACLALPPQAGAVCEEGCESNGNTFLGESALFNLTIGGDNTAVGFRALLSNTTGNHNTASGSEALINNTTGLGNTAVGSGALSNNTTGPGNTAIGLATLSANTLGRLNTAVGHDALGNNTIGKLNTAIGDGALFNNKIGSNNTAIGNHALSTNTGSDNVALGDHAGISLTTGENNIVIGTNVVGSPGDSNTIRIGKGITETFIDGIKGATASGGAAVFVVGEGGKLGTMTSSARFKDEIKPMDKASEAILALRPVSFRYKKDVDPQRLAQFGLVAEEVEKINPDLVIRDTQGRPQTVRYEQVNAMLLNEFLKEHRKNEEQGATIARQRKDFDAALAQQQKQIDALTAGLQKVTAQLAAASPSRGGLEAGKFATGRIRGGGPAPQVVNNP
jgi:hypothetical protein